MHDPCTQNLSFWGVFAVGFITRPVGAILFGHIADATSRKLGLVLSIMVMAVPTVAIGCLPTYEQVGIAAPILLAICRALQGLSVGGEFGLAVRLLRKLKVLTFLVDLYHTGQINWQWLTPPWPSFHTQHCHVCHWKLRRLSTYRRFPLGRAKGLVER